MAAKFNDRSLSYDGSPVHKQSGKGKISPAGSPDIFTVQPGGEKRSVAHSDELQRSPAAQRGIGRTILHGIRSLWATRQTEKDLGKNKDLYVKTTIRELIVYLVFIVVLCIITFGMTSSKTYYFTTVLRTIFTERKIIDIGDQPAFDDIASYDDFWGVMSGPVMNGLFPTQWYNGENVTQDQVGFVLFENKIIGLPRLRQLRMKNNSCVVHKKFRSMIPDCYAPYSSSKEDRDPFGSENVTSKTAWRYQSSSELDGLSDSGLVSRYSGGGYVEDLQRDYSLALAQLNDLKANLWLDRSTRVVFLDFTLYNANINLFCQIKLTVEFPASGGAVPSKSFASVKLIRYVTSMDYFVLACEILFIIFTVYYTVEEVLEIARFKLHYFKTIWNILDVLILLISYICIIFNIYRQVKVSEILDELLNNYNTFSDFEFLSYWQLQFNNVIAFTVFLAWIKIFKYVSFNKTMTQLSTTLSRCAKDVLGFSVMFMIVFLAYAQLGYLLFGSMVEDYKTFSTSIFTLFRIILGDFDFDGTYSACILCNIILPVLAILNVHRVLGPIFFLTYVFFVFFVLLNMFLAIINDTYAEVKNDMGNQQSEFELGEYFKRSYGRMLERLHFKRERVNDIQSALKTADLNKDGVIDFDEWRRALKERGFTDTEIENVFTRYDTDGDRTLRNVEQTRFKTDLNTQAKDLDQDIQNLKDEPGNVNKFAGANFNEVNNLNHISFDEFKILIRRMDRMEYSVGNIVARIDDVLTKLEGMEKGKTKRREVLQRILNSMNEDNHLSKEAKQERLEKMIREELIENIPDRLSPGAPVSFGRTNDSTYYFTNMLAEAFVTSKTKNADSFNDIAQSDGTDFWKAIQGPIFSRLYNNGSKGNYGYILNENKVLGVARLRQVRVKADSCKFHDKFNKRNLTHQCYAAYTVDQEDQSPFGLRLSNVFTADAWNYIPARTTGTSNHRGMVSQYGGGGYVQLLTRNATRTMNILEELKRNSWINRGTRAVFFDLLVYNPNINLFCHVCLLAEYPSSGGVIPTAVIRAVELIQYTSIFDYVILACELAFTLIVILQILECTIKIIRKKHLFLLDAWDLINLISIILSLICIVHEFLFHFSTRKHLNQLLQIETDYPNFNNLFTLKLNLDFYLGLTLALTWLKIFKYLNLNQTMLLLNKTISTCLNELIAFTCIFVIIFLTYAQFGWLFFGRYLTEWRSFSRSIFTLFRMIIGDFDFYAMLNIDEYLGPFFLFSYIYFVYFVLLNMFLAIINQTYSQIVSDTTLQTYQIQGFLKRSRVAVTKSDQNENSGQTKTNRDGENMKPNAE
ncbi:unnamed protein product [Adineta ricciae]|uniref:EF-hand domain-containing protein n=1 Tax=Adineta ricciae TaxID=249248 RepID=A0A814BNM2_ADIRI|nr:unnamed protein product [Adineta ricciae]